MKAAHAEPPLWDDAEFVEGIHEFGVEISSAVPSEPFSILLVNSKGALERTIPVPEQLVRLGTKDQIWFQGITTQQATAVGAALKADGFLRDRGGRAEVLRVNGKTDLRLIVRNGSWDEAAMMPVFDKIAREAAEPIGLPLQLDLLDGHAQVKKTLLIQ